MEQVQKPIRLGVIGCGEHSGHHIKHMDVPFTLLGIFDPDPENADLATRWVTDQPTNYRTIEDLLANPDIEAVIIGSPDQFHPEHLRLAVQAGKHVFIEKPLATDPFGMVVVAEALQLARKKSLIVTSCHPRRFDPAYTGIKQELPQLLKKFGKPVFFHLDFSYHEPSDEWKKDRSLLLDHFPHEIDCMHFYFGLCNFRAHKLSNGFAGYSVAGIRTDGISFMFTGTRALKSKVYPESVLIRFERGDVRVHTKTGKVLVVHHESSTTENMRVDGTGYASRLSLLNQNFFEAVRGTGANYLTEEDLFINTVSAVNLDVNGFTEHKF